MTRGLSVAALERVREAVAPDGRVTRVRPLRGGVSSSVHLVHLTDGANRRAVVVRRYNEYWQRTDPAVCGREFKLLEMLARASFPAPRPILVESAASVFGAPTVVMSRLPGRPLLAPSDLAGYLKQVAKTLVQLHALSTQELGFLPEQRTAVTRRLGESRPETDDALQLEVWDAAVAEWSRLVQQPETHRALVHGDYWPGNLLWVRGRLVGVVDWELPRLGDLARDVATCRGDLWVLFGQKAADLFLQEYEQSAGIRVTDLRFWELFIATEAVPEMKTWAVAYRLLGRPDLTADNAVPRIREFARAALNR